MIGLVQRVSWAKVVVDDQTIAQIDQGILVLLGMEKSDERQQADKLLHRLLNYRIFADAEDKMNLSVKDIKGGVLLVPQFTLAANTKKGLRPSFSSAMPHAEAVLTLRSLKSSGDFEEYWMFHKQQSKKRHYGFL